MKTGTLIIPPIGLGNYLMCLPAIKELKATFKGEAFHLLALKGGIRDLAEPTKEFDQIHTWDPDRESKMAGIKTIFKIRRLKLARVIHLFPTKNPKYALFRACLGIEEHVGFNYKYWGDSLNSFSLEIDKTLHDSNQNFRLAIAYKQHLNKSNFLIDYEILSNADIDKLDYKPIHKNQNFEYDELLNERFLVCHPGSSAERLMEHKRLKPQTLAKVCDFIFNKYQIKTYLAGGPEEKDLRNQVASFLETDCLLDIKCKSLVQLSAILKKSQFFLGNDSGLMHLANSLGIATINFFGPTDEGRTGPWQGIGSPQALILRQNLSCAPCWTIDNLGELKPCIHQDYRCLMNYSINDITPKISNFIEQLGV